MNVTVPLGGVLPAGPFTVTVAVKVTDAPKALGLSEDVSAVAVLDCTACVSAPALGAKLLSPLYAAVML
jgi:hypothetical protein